MPCLTVALLCYQRATAILLCATSLSVAQYRYGPAAAGIHHTWGKVIYDFGAEFTRAHAYDGRMLRVVCDVLAESALPHVASFGAEGLQSEAHSAANQFKVCAF